MRRWYQVPVVSALLGVVLLLGCSDEAPPGLAADGGGGGAGGATFDPVASMIIVTTNLVRDHSTRLADFIRAKEARHIRVLVATEDDYGAPSSRGLERAQQIRDWLVQVHEGYDYLLLIGDPHPEYGDVPLFHARVRDENISECSWSGFDCTRIPTDAFYASLSGDWDVDGDGKFGEYLDDYEGVSFDVDLVTGRIPVYFNDFEALDQIVQTTIDYMDADPSDVDYRRKVLLPAAVLFYEGELGPRADGTLIASYLSETLINDQDPVGKDFTLDVLAEKEGYSPSPYPAAALSRESLIETWSNDYGLVFWTAHGMPTYATRRVWVDDLNQNGVPDKDTEYDEPLLISHEDFATITSRPGLVYMGSCYNASPSSPENLAYMALLGGQAVGVAANTVPASGADLLVEPFAPNDERSFAFTYGTHFIVAAVGGEPPAATLANKKATIGYDRPPDDLLGHTNDPYVAKLILNYFGDPSLTLRSSAADRF